MRTDYLHKAFIFLNHPRVQGVTLEKRIQFLREKGLSNEEISHVVHFLKDSTSKQTENIKNTHDELTNQISLENETDISKHPTNSRKKNWLLGTLGLGLATGYILFNNIFNIRDKIDEWFQSFFDSSLGVTQSKLDMPNETEQTEDAMTHIEQTSLSYTKPNSTHENEVLNQNELLNQISESLSFIHNRFSELKYFDDQKNTNESDIDNKLKAGIIQSEIALLRNLILSRKSHDNSFKLDTNPNTSTGILEMNSSNTTVNLDNSSKNPLEAFNLDLDHLKEIQILNENKKLNIETTKEDILQNKLNAARTSLTKMLEYCPKENILPVINLLLMYFQNLVNHSKIPRYWRISRNNRNFKKILAPIEYVNEFFNANGFFLCKQTNHFGKSSQILEWSPEWRENTDNWSLDVLKDSIYNLRTVVQSLGNDNDSSMISMSNLKKSSIQANELLSISVDNKNEQKCSPELSYEAPPFLLPFKLSQKNLNNSNSKNEKDSPGIPFKQSLLSDINEPTNYKIVNKTSSITNLVEIKEIDELQNMPNEKNIDTEQFEILSCTSPAKPWENESTFFDSTIDTIDPTDNISDTSFIETMITDDIQQGNNKQKPLSLEINTDSPHRGTLPNHLIPFVSPHSPVIDIKPK